MACDTGDPQHASCTFGPPFGPRNMWNCKLSQLVVPMHVAALSLGGHPLSSSKQGPALNHAACKSLCVPQRQLTLLLLWAPDHL